MFDLAFFALLGVVLFLPGLALVANGSNLLGIALIVVAFLIVVAVAVHRNRPPDG